MSKKQTEIDRLQEHVDEFDKSVKDLTLDRMNAAPKEEVEQQTKMSSKEIENSKDVYLKPEKIISSPQKFNEKFREDYNFAKEYVQFIAEHKEIIGEAIEMWTRPFGGMPAEFWRVPVNKPVWGPRYLAEQIKKCSYHRLTMQQNVMTEANSMGQIYGAMVADSTVQRLDAIPVTKRKSVFMGASGF